MLMSPTRTSPTPGRPIRARRRPIRGLGRGPRSRFQSRLSLSSEQVGLLAIMGISGNGTQPSVSELLLLVENLARQEANTPIARARLLDKYNRTDCNLRSAVSARLRSTKVMRLRFTGIMIMERKKEISCRAFAAYIRCPNGDFHVRSGKFAGTAMGGRRPARAAGSLSAVAPTGNDATLSFGLTWVAMVKRSEPYASFPSHCPGCCRSAAHTANFPGGAALSREAPSRKRVLSCQGSSYLLYGGP